VFFTGDVISRAEGVLLFGYHLACTVYLVLAASQHDALSGFSAVMLYFVIPLTAAGLAFTAWNQVRRAGGSVR
jgi:cation:H+ antiporter